jgi:hypothetical protein
MRDYFPGCKQLFIELQRSGHHQSFVFSLVGVGSLGCIISSAYRYQGIRERLQQTVSDSHARDEVNTVFFPARLIYGNLVCMSPSYT